MSSKVSGATILMDNSSPKIEQPEMSDLFPEFFFQQPSTVLDNQTPITILNELAIDSSLHQKSNQPSQINPTISTQTSHLNSIQLPQPLNMTSSYEDIEITLMDISHSSPTIVNVNQDSRIYSQLLLNQAQQIISHEPTPTDSHTHQDMTYQVNLTNETEPTLLPDLFSEMPQSMRIENGQTHFLQLPSTVLDNRILNSTQPFVHQPNYTLSEPPQEAQHEHSIDSSVLQQSTQPFLFQNAQNVDNIQEQEQPQNLVQPEKPKNAKRFQCDRCVNTFKTKNILNQHYRTHTGEKPYKCAICGMAFTQRNQRIKHMKKHKNINKVTIDSQVTQHEQAIDFSFLQNSVQPLLFQNVQNVDNIQEQEQPQNLEPPEKSKNTKRFQCDRCVNTFKTKHTLAQHFLTHTGEKPYKCAICGMTFTQRNQRINHMKKHKNDNKVTIDSQVTQVVNQQLTIEPDPTVEQLNKQTIDRQTECQTSEQQLENDNFDSNVVHVEAQQRTTPESTQQTLEDERKFKCKVCKKCFKKFGQLMQHQITHTEEKKFACERCKKGFKRRGDLKQHQYTHSDDKPYQCVVCKICFKRPWELKKHMKLHMKVRMKQQEKHEINVETIWESQPEVEHEFTHEGVQNEHPNELELMQQSIELMNRQDQEMFGF